MRAEDVAYRLGFNRSVWMRVASAGRSTRMRNGSGSSTHPWRAAQGELMLIVAWEKERPVEWPTRGERPRRSCE